jgi:hypothetical protein
MLHWPVILSFAPLSLFLLVSISLAVLFLRHRMGAWTFSLAGIAAAMGTWALGYLLELLVPTLEQKQFWVNIQYLGTTTAPVLWLIFAMRLTGYSNRLHLPARARSLHLHILLALCSHARCPLGALVTLPHRAGGSTNVHRVA